MPTLALLAVALIWGWTFVLVKQGLSEVGPWWFLSLRFALAAGLSLMLWRPGQDRRQTARGVLLGIALFGGYLFQTWGLMYTTVQKSALITGLSVVLVPPLAHFLGTRAARITWCGAALAAAGLGLLVFGDGKPLGPTGLGDLLTVLCACSFAIYLVLLDRWAKQGDYRALLPPKLAVMAAFAFVGALALERPTFTLSPEVWTAIVITGVLATTVAFGVLAWVERAATAAYTAIVLTMEPVFAGLMGWILLGERLVALQIAGAAAILAGIALPQAQRLRTRGSSPPAPPPGRSHSEPAGV